MSRWLEDLSALLQRSLTRSQDWRTLLYKSDQGIEVFVRRGARIKSIGAISSETSAEGLARLKKKNPRRGSTVLRFATDQVLEKTITLPAAAADVLEPVLRNQMERITPWSQAQATFGYDIKGRNRASDQLEVSVVSTSRESVDETLALARSARFNPSLVDCANGPVRRTGTVLTYVDEGARQRSSRLIVSILGAIFFISFVSFVVGMWDVYRFHIALDQAERQISEARQEIALAKRISAQNEQLRMQSKRLVNLKSERPSVSVLIEVISRKLPDEVWLERLEISRQKALLTGEGGNAAALIAILEGSEHLTNVRFSAPTTRKGKGRKERFTIAAQAVPVFRLGDKP